VSGGQPARKSCHKIQSLLVNPLTAYCSPLTPFFNCSLTLFVHLYKEGEM